MLTYFSNPCSPYINTEFGQNVPLKLLHVYAAQALKCEGWNLSTRKACHLTFCFKSCQLKTSARKELFQRFTFGEMCHLKLVFMYFL